MVSSLMQTMQQPCSWLNTKRVDNRIAMSSRIRLARNLQHLPFAHIASQQQLQEICRIVTDVLQKQTQLKLNLAIFRAEELSIYQQLVERHIISKELLKKKAGVALIYSQDLQQSIMINEEDHLRFQSIIAGNQLQTAYQQIAEYEAIMEQNLAFAFNQKWGYLTACPSNLGTGMRASVMLHLPGLIISKQINAVLRGLKKLHLTVRGLFGEGTQAQGHIFQISNQHTIGLTEEQIINNIHFFAAEIIQHEKNARNSLLLKQPELLKHHIGNAYGTLKYSYLLSFEEACQQLSMLRLASTMKMLAAHNLSRIDNLMLNIQKSHLCQQAENHKLTAKQRDIMRANIVRKAIAKMRLNLSQASPIE